jgi:starch phosphorylase
VIGYGGKTINTLRLWSAATPDYFDFQQFSSGDFVGALAETLTAETLTRVLYRMIRPRRARGCASSSNTSSWPARWPTPSAVPRCGQRLVRAARQVAMQLNDTHPTLACPS